MTDGPEKGFQQAANLQRLVPRKEGNYEFRSPRFQSWQAILGISTKRQRDENGAEADGTGWCHICFHIFPRKRKRIQKLRKQVQNQILPETNMYQIWCGHRQKADDYRNQENHAIKLKQLMLNRQTCSLTLSRLLSVMESRGWVGWAVQFDNVIYCPARLAMQNNYRTKILH
jgi:hypothetical protein